MLSRSKKLLTRVENAQQREFILNGNCAGTHCFKCVIVNTFRIWILTIEFAKKCNKFFLQTSCVTIASSTWYCTNIWIFRRRLLIHWCPYRCCAFSWIFRFFCIFIIKLTLLSLKKQQVRTMTTYWLDCMFSDCELPTFLLLLPSFYTQGLGLGLNFCDPLQKIFCVRPIGSSGVSMMRVNISWQIPSGIFFYGEII